MYDEENQAKMVDRRGVTRGPERGAQCEGTLLKNNSVIGALNHGIEDLSENLFKSIEELNVNLSTILIPKEVTVDDGKKNPVPPVSLCQLTIMVNEYNKKVQRAISVIQDIIKRCEL